MKKKTEIQQNLRWYHRGTGMFCGGFLGFCLASLLAMFIGDLATWPIVILVGSGLASGIAVGYLFPPLTEAVWWILSFFG